MKFKLIATAAMVLGLATTAYADQKVAEFGDPVIGNSYGGCTFTQVYGTGGGGYGFSYLYTEYSISCSSGVYKVGVYAATNTNYGFPVTSCTFYPGSSSYYVSGDCNNWRVYLRP